VDDVVQEVWLAFARDSHKVDAEHAAGWLRAVARTKVVDHVRHRRDALTDPPEPPSAAPSPEDTLRSRELAESVRRAMAEIVVSRRRVLDAVALEGRPLAEVAREEGIPESTARSRLRDGEADLRGVLSRRREGERRRSGFTSWVAAWGLLDLRRLRWPLAAAVAGGALAMWPASAEAPRRALPAAVAPVALVEDPRPADAPPWRAERVEAVGVVAVPARARHDAGRRFRVERFGAETHRTGVLLTR
jgi:RNA polymerase sigma-70 factor (ECF subfamily)